MRTRAEVGVTQVESDVFDEFNFALASDYEKARALRAFTRASIWFEDEGRALDQPTCGNGNLVPFVGMVVRSANKERSFTPKVNWDWVSCESCSPVVKEYLLLHQKRYTFSEMIARERFGTPNIFQSWIVLVAAKPVATVSVFINDTGVAGFFDLWVTPKNRGSEMARAVACTAVHKAIEMGARICVVQALPRVATFLERIGFIRTSELIMWLPDPNQAQNGSTVRH